MIFLDANVFLRYIVEPTPDDPNGPAFQAIATELFAAVERGAQEATTSEVVIHEVCYVLASRRQYGLPASQIATLMEPIIRMPGMVLGRGEKGLYLRAFDILIEYPRLEFADALIAARTERLGVPLATFDERLARLPSVTRWDPPEGN